MIKGFLFDMDGTVFDTERVYKESWHEVSKELGYDIPDQLLDMMRGSSRQSAIKIFNDFYGDDPHDYVEARQLREVVADRRLREGGVPLKPGARELTTYLRDKGISLALATSTYRPVVDFYLSDSGMEDVFDLIITGDMIERGKPEPDIFIRAARELGLEPSECVICEDSLNGIIAGRRSGARVYYIPDLNDISKEELELYTDGTFQSLTDMLAFISGSGDTFFL